MPETPRDPSRPRERGGGALAVGAGIFLSRIAGLVRERVIAHYLGLSPAAAAFRAALRIPNLLQNLLGELGLTSLSRSRAYTLSGGERRRVEITRALVNSPKFILLDEPASGLTHAEIDRLATVIDGLRHQGLGVLLVEHHTDLVFSLSDAVTTLNFGRVICSGSPADVRLDSQVRRVYLGG